MTLQFVLVFVIILSLLILLYTELLSPAISFLSAAFAMVLVGVISIEEMLLGLSNKQVLVIFLLMVLTTGIQQSLGKGFFYKVFQPQLSAKAFRLRMMLSVASISSFLNNTPVVALMLPYVKAWSEEKGLSASKFLIPLSFATILGGMITLVGTSTNLILNGLISNAGLELLQFQDFLYLGLLVSCLGIAYLYFFSDSLLPAHEDTKKQLQNNLQEYLVETEVQIESSLIGKSVEQAGLRHLKDLFLVEIHRSNQEVLSVVDAEEKIFAGDKLFFAGNPSAILRLINQKNGLSLPESTHVQKNGYFQLTEAVIPSGSSLIGESLKSSSFRDQFKASVISIYRKGEKVSGNLGEIQIEAGDLFLLLSKEGKSRFVERKNLLYLSTKGKVENSPSAKELIPAILSLILLLMGIFGLIDLFISVSAGIGFMLLFKVLTKELIRKSFDLDLILVLISSLAIGLGIQNSGLAEWLINSLLVYTGDLAIWLNLSVLFLATLLLTSLVTNVAAVSIMFPFALEMSQYFGFSAIPFFVIIAFAASADFLTPIGYQTNLMVMGPGNYRIKDYSRIGFPLTTIYACVVLTFVTNYYF